MLPRKHASGMTGLVDTAIVWLVRFYHRIVGRALIRFPITYETPPRLFLRERRS